MSIDAMKMVIEFLEKEGSTQAQFISRKLRAAIEAAERQEPVARLYDDGTYITIGRDLFRPPYVRDQGIEVFTTPQTAIPAGLQVTLDYTVLHQYADDIGINYNDLCAIVRTSIIGFAVPKPENSHG